MMYQYTPYGWYTSAAIPGRTTDIAPPDASMTTTPGAPRANWDGRAWVMQPYVTEPAPSTAPPPPIVPAVVTMRQARLALLGAGLLSQVNSAIAGMTGMQGEAARIEWEFSSDVRRQQPLVMALGPALGLSAAQLDALFVAAGAL